jgi:hypothetical protein
MIWLIWLNIHLRRGGFQRCDGCAAYHAQVSLVDAR